MLWDRHVAARLLTAAALLPCAPIGCSRTASPQRWPASPSLGRRNRFRIKKAAVWHRELRFDHIPDQLVHRAGVASFPVRLGWPQISWPRLVSTQRDRCRAYWFGVELPRSFAVGLEPKS
jgi:hypothetical protein